MTEQLTQDLFTRVRSTIPVQGVDPAVIVAAARRRRRRRAGLAVAVAAGLVVAAMATYVVSTEETPPDPADPPALQFEARLNPLPVAWWAEGELHLGDQVAPMAWPRNLVAAGTGLLVREADGQVVQVTVDGTRRLLGTAASAPVVADTGDVAAWREGGEDGDLVVYDLALGEERARVPLAGGGAPWAIDLGHVYGSGADGVWRLATGSGDQTVEREDPGLVAAASGVRVVVSAGAGDVFRVEQPLFNLDVEANGVPVLLAHDGNHLLGADPYSGSRFVLDARSGERADLVAPAGSRMLEWQFAGDDLVVAVARGDEITVRTCVLSAEDRRTDLPLAQCRSSARLPVDWHDGRPDLLFAG